MTMNEDILFGGIDEQKRNEVKYNIFRFQDHLNFQIQLAAKCFLAKDYNSLFQTLETLYSDTIGFYSEKEIEELNVLHIKCANILSQNEEGIHRALLDFKFLLMRLMAKHQLLIPIIKKGIGSATSEL